MRGAGRGGAKESEQIEAQQKGIQAERISILLALLLPRWRLWQQW
jgi:hypothetical protein